ncbi:MAG: molybdopterin cofactor-binding domain-containing protein [Salinisphaeraceae bacterium]
MTTDTIDTGRREFLKHSALAGAGLVIGMTLPGRGRAQVPEADSGAAAFFRADATTADFSPNAFVRIAPDSTVTVLIKHIEFGQGPFTGLATLVAEELDADWGQMRARSAPADAELYKNLAFGVQGTGGSTAMANSYNQMRKAGAAARALLVRAAADAWEVPAGEITVSQGVIAHEGSGKTASFGEFAEAASEFEPPEDVTLKPADQFRLIGTDVPKLDTSIKSNGQAQFTLDVMRDDMLTVVVAHPPKFGATVAAVDDAAARKVPGVEDVQTIPSGVAVYARDTWAAMQGRKALKIDWDEAGAEMRSTEQITADFETLSEKVGNIATDRGDVAGAQPGLAKRLDAVYRFPYLAHAPMETLDCVIQAQGDSVEAWFGSQIQTLDQQAIGEVLGIEPGKVVIHTMYAGGSFGRRATQASHLAREAAEVAKVHGQSRPLKLVWSREDDIQGGWYRPLNVHRLSGGIDDDGNIVAWDQTIVGQSIMAGSAFAGQIKDGIDPTSVEGALNLPYRLPNLRVSLHSPESPVPVLWWRSVGHTHTAYSTETFLDELLEMAGKDPIDGRLELLDEHPRHAGVLREVAKLAEAAGPAPEGRARGVALHKSFSSYVAEIAEVSRGDEGPRVHRVWCAVDCGVAVNPNVIRAQMEGGIGYGLGAIMFDAITLEEGGRVRQSNFDGYRSLRIHEMPEVEVSIVKSAEDPTGVGEPGTPPIGPAVANAWRRLTGESVRDLPFVKPA